MKKKVIGVSAWSIWRGMPHIYLYVMMKRPAGVRCFLFFRKHSYLQFNSEENMQSCCLPPISFVFFRGTGEEFSGVSGRLHFRCFLGKMIKIGRMEIVLSRTFVKMVLPPLPHLTSP